MKLDPTRWAPKHYYKRILLCEFVFLFFCLPVFLYFVRDLIAPYILLFLVSVVGWCVLLLLSDPRFKRFRLWNPEQLKISLDRVVLSFLIAALFMAVASWYFTPQWFFTLPTQQTKWWFLLLVIYPIFSAWPQEVIFRTFMFHRYKRLFKSKTLRAYLSAISFALAHLLFANWIAVVGAFIAGLVFSFTYIHSRSTLLVAVEHSLWGCWLFTAGLGMYFDSTMRLYGE